MPVEPGDALLERMSIGNAETIDPRLWPVPNGMPAAVRSARAAFSAAYWT